MKKIFLLLFFMATSLIWAKAQTPSTKTMLDTLVFESIVTPSPRLDYEYTLWGINVFQNSNQLSQKNIREILANYPDEYQQYRCGRTKLMFGGAGIILGAASLGYGLFTTVNAYGGHYGFTGGDKARGFGFLGAGALLATGGVLLFLNGQSDMRYAIASYNNNAAVASVNIGVCPNGIGLLVNF